MGYDVTRQGLGWTLLLFALLLLLFWERSALCPVPGDPLAAGDMPLGMWLARIAREWPVLSGALCCLLALCTGVLLVRIVSRNMILLERTYMPIVLYAAIACGGYFGPALLPALSASLLLVFSYDTMLASFRRIVRFGSLFNAAILSGLAPLVWSHTAVYALLLPFALVVFKKGGREWIVAWVGLLLPLAICSYVSWGTGGSFSAPALALGDRIAAGFSGDGTEAGAIHPALWVFWGICFLVSVLSIVTFWKRSGTMRTRAYKSYVYFLWILLFSALPLVWPGRGVADLALAAAPLSVVIPAYFNRRSGWIPDTIYLLLIGSVVCYNLIGILSCGGN